ncbi:head-tail connector protein [Paenibacillus larvae]|uniref:head-tail connector protein n=1 Tax=Paenibacillus larvae TaxID=1464 RepID=UPI00227E7B0D|nr:head-tail connector protein [Paenibacillus larvae]UYL93196.1 head-tail connector protein [Paenibacillus phage Callan]UYL93273.1 head-tail connector protein [Paenibacillus phage Dash]UYL93352.1 head-tail connector protein [Paenibacillus phage Lilo]MCY7478853.1 head-tail connector protein [Paenibacillus larvae]MDE5168589.1 head-tail connector protein [Paenibacillus larvae subsp. larvae]
MITLEEVKTYMRIDNEDDDRKLSSLLFSAVSYMKNAVGSGLDSNDELYKLACCMLVCHWYENAGVTGKEDVLPLGINSIVTQLQGKYGGGTSEPREIK